ncbi:MAG TPA: hypothetical protein VNL92_04250 [Dehalococcoidia bacterium]|nr:hypothetical protein [Dehalococcoidia bacterium]
MEKSEEDRLTIQACRSEARALGYTLLVDEVPNLGELTHAAFAAPYIPGQPSMGRFLAYGRSAVEAAELGADLLRRIVERNEPWPSK